MFILTKILDYTAIRFYLKFFELFLLYFMCMGILPACMSVHRMHAWCPQRSNFYPYY